MIYRASEWACESCTLLNAWGTSACAACGRKAPTPPVIPIPPLQQAPAVVPSSSPVAMSGSPVTYPLITPPLPLPINAPIVAMPPSTGGHYIPPQPSPSAPSPANAQVYTPTGVNGQLVPTGPNTLPAPLGAPPSVPGMPGKAGICVTCGKPADFICSQTKVTSDQPTNTNISMR
jgi:hypothetical protein